MASKVRQYFTGIFDCLRTSVQGLCHSLQGTKAFPSEILTLCWSFSLQLEFIISLFESNIIEKLLNPVNLYFIARTSKFFF